MNAKEKMKLLKNAITSDKGLWFKGGTISSLWQVRSIEKEGSKHIAIGDSRSQELTPEVIDMLLSKNSLI